MESDLNSPVNMGHPKQITILELAKKVRAKINPNLEIIYKPLPQDDPLKRQPDIDKAKKELSWYPKTSLEEGLDKTINWFKEFF